MTLTQWQGSTTKSCVHLMGCHLVSPVAGRLNERPFKRTDDQWLVLSSGQCNAHDVYVGAEASSAIQQALPNHLLRVAIEKSVDRNVCRGFQALRACKSQSIAKDCLLASCL